MKFRKSFLLALLGLTLISCSDVYPKYPTNNTTTTVNNEVVITTESITKKPTTYTSVYTTKTATKLFSNKFGTASTVCAHKDCYNYIANSGDTNCCTSHSRRCSVCNCYIDEDALACMDCLKKVLIK